MWDSTMARKVKSWNATYKKLKEQHHHGKAHGDKSHQNKTKKEPSLGRTSKSQCQTKSVENSGKV